MRDRVRRKTSSICLILCEETKNKICLGSVVFTTGRKSWLHLREETSLSVFLMTKYFIVISMFWLSYSRTFSRCIIHHHHHVMPLARISLTLSHHFSLSFIAAGRSSGLHPVSSHSCRMHVQAGRPAFAQPYVGIHRSTSHMSSSLLLQQCPACLVRLTWIVFVMGGRWLYSWCLVGVLPPGLVQYCYATFLCNCRLTSSPAVFIASK